MKRIIPLSLLLVALFSMGCNSKVKNIFRGERTPHEAYQDKLDDKDLDKTPLGRQWLVASEAALQSPYQIQIPYKQHGYFHIDKPRALGLQFNAKAGERITFHLNKKSKSSFVIYADVYKQTGSGTSHLLSADTINETFSFDADEGASYVLRLQPELFRTGEYSLSVEIGPSLIFPVSGSKAKAGSFWGANRDGGKRSHEGVDIFAPKGTPAIAGADGYITGVKEGGIGGKVVWLRPEGKNYTLYYAHLDEQLVQEGQVVKKGDTIGTVGNTGNAKTTPAHLHFGIYTYRGAIDPWPFVNKTIKEAPDVSAKNLITYLKLIKDIKSVDGRAVSVNTTLIPLAVTSKGYIAEAEDGRLVQAPVNMVKTIAVEKKGRDLAGTR
jgi:murein DD-endopeptidase MepM/ murein hydrolase activator NlpD